MEGLQQFCISTDTSSVNGSERQRPACNLYDFPVTVSPSVDVHRNGLPRHWPAIRSRESHQIRHHLSADINRVRKLWIGGWIRARHCGKYPSNPVSFIGRISRAERQWSGRSGTGLGEDMCNITSKN